MKSPQLFRCWNRFVSIAMILFGMFLLSINLESIHSSFGYSTNAPHTKRLDEGFEWMDTTGITLSHIVGDPRTCKDVVYTGDSRDPFGAAEEDNTIDSEVMTWAWRGIAHVVRTSPAHKRNTCFVFFGIASPWIDTIGRVFHSAWGRIPATALVMSAFPQADVFLYMDPDALLVFSDKTPTMMYKELAFDGHGEDATMQHLQPGLIVNKPGTGWLCEQCEKFGLGHGCFNSGVLLWHRSNAEPILRAWWESRNMPVTENVFEGGEAFHGWSDEHGDPVGDQMAELNRLMYIYGTDAQVRDLLWPVPRQKSDETKSESCPNALDYGHTPCLQDDFFRTSNWNSHEPSCFTINYDDQYKDAIKHANMMMKDTIV